MTGLSKAAADFQKGDCQTYQNYSWLCRSSLISDSACTPDTRLRTAPGPLNACTPTWIRNKSLSSSRATAPARAQAHASRNMASARSHDVESGQALDQPAEHNMLTQIDHGLAGVGRVGVMLWLELFARAQPYGGTVLIRLSEWGETASALPALESRKTTTRPPPT